MASPTNAQFSPRKIGPYQVIRILGEGGMGTVYEAEQASPHRRVALKMIRAERATDQMQWRFERESEALGRLQHPGIAQIYVAGTIDEIDGPHSYFAMELVQGRSLTAHAASLSSDAERVALFASICDAVHYAHQRGVIHRDLKPANILVDDTGQPKILDFGVARLIDADVHGTRATHAGEVVGTLQYMSPEQLSGDPLSIDVRSDVYALGLILYELLAGRTPYDLTGRQLMEAIRVVVSLDPPMLDSVDRRLRGDLAVIASKAIEKDAARRYQSAADLASDLRRHLRDEPITARPASTTYQLRKFARRHRAAAVAAVVSAIALVGATGVSTAMALRARAAQRTSESRRIEASDARTLAEQRRREAEAGRAAADSGRLSADSGRAAAIASAEAARREQAKAVAVNQFLQEMLSSGDPEVARGRKPTVEQAVNDAASRVNAGALRNQPDVEATVRLTIGNTYRRIASLDSALGHLQSAYKLVHANHAPNDPLVADAAEGLGEVLRDKADYAGADKAYREALAIRRQTLAADDDRIVSILRELAFIRYAQGRVPESDTLRRRALALSRQRHKTPHPELAISIQRLAEHLVFTDRAQESDTLWREVIPMLQQLYPSVHPDLASAELNYAYTLDLLRRYDEAERTARAALADVRAIYGDEPRMMANALIRLGVILYHQNKDTAAESMLRQAVELRRAALGENHSDVSFARVQLARVLARLKRGAEAETLFAAALAGRRATLGNRHPAVASSIDDMASMAITRGDHATAERLYRESGSIWREAKLPRSELVAITRAAEAAVRQQRFASADTLMRDVLARQPVNEASSQVAAAIEVFAQALRGTGRLAEADSSLGVAAGMRQKLIKKP